MPTFDNEGVNTLKRKAKPVEPDQQPSLFTGTPTVQPIPHAQVVTKTVTVPTHFGVTVNTVLPSSYLKKKDEDAPTFETVELAKSVESTKEKKSFVRQNKLPFRKVTLILLAAILAFAIVLMIVCGVWMAYKFDILNKFIAARQETSQAVAETQSDKDADILSVNTDLGTTQTEDEQQNNDAPIINENKPVAVDNAAAERKETKKTRKPSSKKDAGKSRDKHNQKTAATETTSEKKDTTTTTTTTTTRRRRRAAGSSEKTFFDFTVPSIEGGDLELSIFRGRFILFTTVVAEAEEFYKLNALSQNFYHRGFEVVAVPASSQDSLDDIDEIAVETQASNFFFLSHIDLDGPNQHPLVEYIRKTLNIPTGEIDMILVNKEGTPVKQFDVSTPLDVLEESIEKLIQS